MNAESEIIQVRARGEITIPKNVRKWINVEFFDWIGFDLMDDGVVCIHRVIPHRVPNKNHQT